MVTYDCGPHAAFYVDGVNQDFFDVTCQWNETWTADRLPPCKRKKENPDLSI
jgi:hypothetical protein